ncbi:hypothetical protein DEU56DRAFT_753084 [Suillus clintonianus]|uniref:uncharacterized protein n=1 Tax=Suillus clintonianus TaxID=1904413 RepID=UPI001B861904|nr:uncharacterized protein DEU56DRAFT_753084 [Suillus clintonianus]KAG2148845.1 hypothetical protein DEU56DRAFT_753084 [Suillus clintonianus]
MGFISEPRKAKTRAMENAVWKPKATKIAHQPSPPTRLGSSGPGGGIYQKQKKISTKHPAPSANKNIQRTKVDPPPDVTAHMMMRMKTWDLNSKNLEDVSALSKSDELDSDEQTPTWRDLDNAVSESINETTTTCGDSEPYSSDSANPKLTSAARHSIASLIRTESGKVKLLDQNQETRRVVWDAIVDAKCHIVFVDAYPELIDKNQVSLQSLLTVAGERGLHAIKQCLQADATYAVQLSSLVEPHIPILRRELKEVACANIDSYFRLGHNVVKAKRLMEKHAYICFEVRFFNGAKSIGVKYAERFIKIANNKANRPKIPVPLLVLVATSVYNALFWKTLGSPGKFNFTGNQFSETYVFHVKFLEDLKKDAPGKFHRLMADIYGAVQALKRKGNDNMATEHEDALALLDLDGMVED